MKFKNIGAGPTRELTLTMELTGIKYSHTKGLGFAACPEGSASNGKLNAKGVVTGETDPGSQHVGIFMSNA